MAEDLKVLGNWKYVVKIGEPEKNAIYMTLKTSDTQLGEEGYRMTIGEGVTIEAPARQRCFLGYPFFVADVAAAGDRAGEGNYPRLSEVFPSRFYARCGPEVYFPAFFAGLCEDYVLL